MADIRIGQAGSEMFDEKKNMVHSRVIDFA